MERQSAGLSEESLRRRDAASSVSLGSTSRGTQHTELTQFEEPPAKKARPWYEDRFEPVALKHKEFSHVFVKNAQVPGERPETQEECVAKINDWLGVVFRPFRADKKKPENRCRGDLRRQPLCSFQFSGVLQHKRHGLGYLLPPPSPPP